MAVELNRLMTREQALAAAFGDELSERLAGLQGEFVEAVANVEEQDRKLLVEVAFLQRKVAALEGQLTAILSRPIGNAEGQAVKVVNEVEVPSVSVTNEVATPTVNVTNEMTPPSVTVNNEVPVPIVNASLDLTTFAEAHERGLRALASALEGFGEMIGQLVEVCSTAKPPRVTVKPQVNIPVPTEAEGSPTEAQPKTLRITHSDGTESFVQEMP